MMRRPILLLVVCLLALGCRAQADEARTSPLEFVTPIVEKAIAERAFPAAAVAIGTADGALWTKGYGTFTYEDAKAITPNTSFDLASVTKVVATTTAVMQLYEAGLLDLDAPVASYVPAFAQMDKERITVRHLLTHTSGMIPFRPFHRLGVTSPEEVLAYIYADTLVYEPGTAMRYSDFNMIMVARIVEEISGMPFSAYAQSRIFDPLGMANTGFRAAQTDTTVVPTEQDDYFRMRLVQGEVHDETAWILGGTAGHAGLFSTAEDLARFALMMVRGGRVGESQFLKSKTIAYFTKPVDPQAHTRALGWDTRSLKGYSSAGQYFGPHSYGHTGFTGTSMWIDPEAGLFTILLTNRVYPTREGRGHINVRPRVADAAWQAVMGPSVPRYPEARR